MTFTITLTEQQVADLIAATELHNQQAAITNAPADLTPEDYFLLKATGYLDAMSAVRRERVANEVLASAEVQALIDSKLRPRP